MPRNISTSSASLSLRVAGVSFCEPANNDDDNNNDEDEALIDEDVSLTSKLLWGALDLCTAAGGAQTTPHTAGLVPSGAVPWPALTNIAITFRTDTYTDELLANIPILGPLTARLHAAASAGPVQALRNLQQLTIVNNANDESAALGAFAALATNLKALNFERCGLTSLAGLADCWDGLLKIDLFGCRGITNLGGLEGHRWLQEIDVSETPVASIEPLLTCPALTKVTLDDCKELTSLAGLEGHMLLREVIANSASLRSVEPLRTCPALTRVNIMGCSKITSLAGLEGHTQLLEVNATYTGITSVEPLKTCPALTKVHLRHCRQLVDGGDLPTNIQLVLKL